MRARIIILFATLTTSFAYAQYDSKGANEISRFKPGFMWYYNGFYPAKPDSPRKYDRLILDVTYNDWVGDRDLFQNNWASIGLNTNWMFDIPLTKGNKVALGVGICHQLTRIRHNNHLIGDDLTKTTSFIEKDSTDTFFKSGFGGNSISVPLELRFRSESWRHFKFHIGGRFGYQLNMYDKYYYKTDSGREIVKHVGFPDQSIWVYSAHFRLGFRNWSLYGSYSFNPLFTSSNSTKLNVVQFGLSLSLF